MCISDFPASNLKRVQVCDTVQLSPTRCFPPTSHTDTYSGCKSLSLCCSLLRSPWLCLSSLEHFATWVINIINIIIFIIKLDQNHHLTLLSECSPPGGIHPNTQAYTVTPVTRAVADHRRSSGSALKSPAPSKAKACLSVMWAITALSDRGRVTLSGRAECTSVRPGRSG